MMQISAALHPQMRQGSPFPYSLSPANAWPPKNLYVDTERIKEPLLSSNPITFMVSEALLWMREATVASCEYHK